MIRKILITGVALLSISLMSVVSQNESVAKTNLSSNIKLEKRMTKTDSIKVFFKDYKENAQLYLDRDVFKGTPLTGKLLAECAKNAYDSTGVIVPMELALSQAQWESGMGRKGLSHTTNPYNVGEYDTYTRFRFESTEDGVQAYFYLIANKYLSDKPVDKLLSNFVNEKGKRYASSKTYEKHINYTYGYIQRWVVKNHDAASI